MIGKRISLRDRFWSNVNTGKPNECWLWIGPLNHDGYGKISMGGRYGPTLRAHRVAWMLANGPIPKGLCVLHHCDNPRCCNLAHLWLGTHADNMADMVAKGRQANGQTKLTREEVLAIRKDKRSQRKLGKLYGVDPTQIGRIKRRAQWGWL